MKERPILFSAEMVRSILEGTKTQTRRVITPQPEVVAHNTSINQDVYRWKKYLWFADERIKAASHCPYGKPGDQLWVREGIRRHFPLEATYIADFTPVMGKGPTGSSLYGRAQVAWLWKHDYLSARFMPRWASRINLEITEIRVERLQEISGKDCLREGITKTTEGKLLLGSHLVYSFREVWDKLNAKRGYPWESNPWVWVISFKKL